MKGMKLSYPEPTADTPWLSGLACLRVDAVDRWLDEDDEVIGRLPDPYHRVDLRHTSRRIVVTASVDNVSFRDAIRLGNVVTLQAQVTRAFSSSMEVHIDVWAEDIPSGTKMKTNEAFFTLL